MSCLCSKEICTRLRPLNQGDSDKPVTLPGWSESNAYNGIDNSSWSNEGLALMLLPRSEGHWESRVTGHLHRQHLNRQKTTQAQVLLLFTCTPLHAPSASHYRTPRSWERGQEWRERERQWEREGDGEGEGEGGKEGETNRQKIDCQKMGDILSWLYICWHFMDARNIEIYVTFVRRNIDVWHINLLCNIICFICFICLCVRYTGRINISQKFVIWLRVCLPKDED